MKDKRKKEMEALRNRAEEMLRGGAARRKEYSAKEAAEVIHELQVHRIELEIQNDELRKTQEDLMASRDRFSRLFHRAPVGYLVLDENGIIIESNETLCRMAGRHADRLRGKGFPDLLAEDDRKTFLSRYRAFFKNPSGKVLESRLSNVEGPTVNIRMEGSRLVDEKIASGEPPRLLIAISDITEKIKAEEEQRESEWRFRMLADSGLALIWASGTDGKCDYFNKTWLEFTGRSLEEELGDGWAGGVHPDDMEMCLSTYLNAFSNRESFSMTYRLRRHDGEYRWLMDKGTPRYDSRGAFLGYLGHCLDITDLVRAQEEVHANEARLRSLVSILQHDTPSLQEYLDYALNEAIGMTDSKIGYIYFYDDRRKRFILNSWSNDVMKECSITEPQTCYELEKTGVWGEAVRQGKPIILNDFQAAHPLKRGYPRGHANLYRYMTIPVFSGGRIVAVVGVANKDSDYNDGDVLQLTLLMEGVWMEVERRKSEAALGERLKEINCLYSVSALLEDREMSMESRLSKVVSLIPPALMYPEIAEARILLDGLEYRTDGFAECPWFIEREIVVNGRPSGSVKICYREGRAGFDEGPFLDEERNLLHEVAGKIGRFVEKSRAELALLENERYLSTILRTTVDGFWVINSEKKFIEVNDAYCRMTGYSREELLNLTISDIEAAEKPEETAERINRIIKIGGETFETIQRKKDGSVFTVEVSATYLNADGGKFISFCRDITERKRNENELVYHDRKNEALLRASRAVLENREFIPAARSIFDICRDLTGATAGYVALLTGDGYENEVLFLDAGGRPCSVDPELPMPIRGLRGEAYRDLTAVYDNDFHNSRWMEFMPEGHVRLDNVLFAPLVIGGKAVGLIGLANKEGGFNEDDKKIAAAFGDIAAIALMNSRNLESLEESVKERAMLFRELQHRVKNSFAMISGMVSIERDRSPEEAVREALNILRARINSLAKLYDILYLSGDIRRVRLDEYLGQVVRSLTETFAAGSGSVTATTRFERVEADAKNAASYGIIVNELVTNALKYGFRDNRSGTLHVDLAERDGIIEIAVSDDGAGLPADFDLSKGGGFGTQVVTLLAKQLGGTVEFERGEKTVFRVKVKR